MTLSGNRHGQFPQVGRPPRGAAELSAARPTVRGVSTGLSAQLVSAQLVSARLVSAPRSVAVQGTFDELGVPLREVTFVVVDLETTGGSPATSGITEIGAVKVRGGEVLG